MRFLRLLALLALPALAACADLKNVMALAEALQVHYHLPANVNINNGSHLAITFQNVDASLKTDSAGRAAFAHDVAVFAKAHYPAAEELDDISIRFATVSSSGPLTTTRTDAPYSFTVAELK